MPAKNIVIVLLIFLPFSAAFSTSAWQAGFEISPEGFSDVEVLLVVDSSSKIIFPNFGCDSISAYDSQGSIAASIKNGNIEITPREAVPKYSFTLNCTSSSLAKKDSQWVFSATLPFPAESAGSIKLSLPENAVLLSNSPEGKIFVEDSKLTIFFDGANRFSASYSLNKKAESIQDYSLFIFTGIFLILLVAYFSFVYYKNKSKSTKEANSKSAELYMKYLLDNEKKIVEVLHSEKRLTQRKLQILTGLPKSTLSRNLKKLENKGIVKCTDAGSTRFVELLEK